MMDNRAKKNRQLWMLVKSLGQQIGNHDDAEAIARQLALELCETEHISALDIFGLEIVCRHLAARLRGEAPPPPSRPPQGRAGERFHAPRGTVGLITMKQRVLIEKLYARLGWLDHKQQTGFCQRILKNDRPRTTAEASKLIQALLAMQHADGNKKPESERKQRQRQI